MSNSGLPLVRAFFFGVVALTLVGCGSEDRAARDVKEEKKVEAKKIEIFVDVHELIGQSQAHVSETVGSEPVCEPDKVPGHGEGLRCKWGRPTIDALFYGDKLRRAEIAGVRFLDFTAASGAAFGIDTTPTLNNGNVIEWAVDGYEASIFPDGNGLVEYFYLSDGK